MNVLTRREFTRSIAAAIGARLLPVNRAESLRVGLLLPSIGIEARDASQGVQLALAENQRSAALFGRHIELIEKSIDGLGTPEVINFIRDRRLDVVIGGLSLGQARVLKAAAYNKLFINIGAREDALRREDCLRPMYNVAASEAMIASALSSASSADGATIEVWHSSLERYGAAQLNDRFRARFARPMTSLAWAGWFALKLVWEESLRVEKSEFARTLDRDATQFDGHKGAPLSFRAWDHQLRQPLYVVRDGRVVAEVPDVAKNSDQPMREQLDRLGDTEASTHCSFERG